MPKTAVSSQKRVYIKHKKRMFVILAVLLVLVVIPTTALAYTGFVPGLTSLTGTNKPVDLGVHYSAADFRSLQQKAQLHVSNFDKSQGVAQDVEKVSPGAQLVIFGGDSNNVTLTQEELTAFLNMIPWTASPLTNSQIRLSSGTFEFSGNIKSAYVSDLIQTVYPRGDSGGLNPVLKLAGHLYNPAVYLKARISATNVIGGPGHGRLMLKLLALKVDRMDLSSKVSNMNEINVTIPEGSFEQGTAYSVSSLNVSDGSLAAYGTLPTNFSVGDGEPGVVCDNYHGGSLVSLNAVGGHIGSVVKSCP